ncbi:MAG TPA: N-acetylmuramoyl-L-alanine amidase-like domain-containing protein [Gemmatimonadales bacterium]|nr:N-acetylmuramoyl-L-alanine amidase-like domain-containing protein [Gemmatimonadales bacterium]
MQRRDFLLALAAAPAIPHLTRQSNEDRRRLVTWTMALRHEPPLDTLGARAVRVGELAAGSPYTPYTLEAYLKAGGSPATEPLTLSLTQFDCVTLVESCLAVARGSAINGDPTWDRFALLVQQMRYRGGTREGYASRLHYFSEWIQDGVARGLVKDLSADLGGMVDDRPLRFMSEHRASYPALADDRTFDQIKAMERRLDAVARRPVPVAAIPGVMDGIQSGDVLAFATSIEGLDVTHSAFAYRDKDNVLRVLHAPLSGGVVEVTRKTLPEYVGAIRKATGILVARPIRGG